MFVVLPIIIIFLFGFLRALYYELQRQDQLRLNATLSKNMSYLLDDFDDAWLTVRVLDNITKFENKTLVTPASKIHPNWTLVLGTFEHFKDENFEEFLISAGAPAFIRNIILSATPTVTIEKVSKDDYYYYDIENDYPDPDYDHVDEKENGVFQMVITSVTWLRTHTTRFRLGYTYVISDFDGTESKNTFRFAAPNVLVHDKEKEVLSTSLIRKFDDDGIVLTIINKENGMVAKRHYKRI
ncbi:hypothetical protein SK128_006274 [Halocaridina rubra]|uniref:Uncharacterized protein n=1 Tax=Halocaridina rubra TaxID=373956 RepID=A0AAN9ADV2_HALRR